MLKGAPQAWAPFVLCSQTFITQINEHHHVLQDTICINLVQAHKPGCVVYFSHGKNCIIIYG